MRRRRFLGAGLAATAGLLVPGRASAARSASPAALALRALRARLPDLRRRFVFEYYPWYGADPYRHWDAEDRTPPADVASPYMPRLGPYDSRARAVIEQHARWIAESGAGSVNLSWWGKDSYEDRAAHTVMDVMRAHDLKVSFHLEPYADDHGRRAAEDILYLVEEFGERRGFDALLLLQDADGSVGPVFKGFRTILPATVRDCRGEPRVVTDFTSDAEWRAQLDGLRASLAGSFGRVRVFADTTDVERAASAGFDGIALYDNLTAPARYLPVARTASARGLLFSFNVNAGFSAIAPRRPELNECGQPIVSPPFTPSTDDLDLTTAAGRELAAALSRQRMVESFAATVAAQTNPALSNAQRGFFLAYVNSFNEWHEGSAFEPMKDAAALSPAERLAGYYNPARGDYRLSLFKELLAG